MAEFRSPLAAVYRPGDFGATMDDGPGVTLSQFRPGGLVQLAGWEDFEAIAAPVLAELGFADAGRFGDSVFANGRRLFRLAPDRILIASETPVEPPKIEPGVDLTVLDLSHSRIGLCVEGREAENLLARLAPIDFRASALPVDGFVQTGIHHVGVLICRTEAMKFEILVPVTWARSTWEMMCLNARSFGYRVTAPS